MTTDTPTFEPITRPSSPYLDGILGKMFPVLDHGFVRVVDYMGNDSSIVQAARVSYGKGTTTSSDDKSLISYLIENKHTSPLEMAVIKTHIRAPIFVARQWFRHRASSYNEYSGRYSVMPCDFYIPTPTDICKQSKSNKQGRAERLDDATTQHVLDLLQGISDGAVDTYKDLVDTKLAKELARIGLTLNTYTEWYWKIDAHNLFNFIRLRNHPHAQKEIRVYAEVIQDICRGWMPYAMEAFENFYIKGENFSGGALVYLQARIAHPGETIAPTPGMSRREKKKIDAMFPEVTPNLFKRICDTIVSNLRDPKDHI